MAERGKSTDAQPIKGAASFPESKKPTSTFLHQINAEADEPAMNNYR
jgi:hypothetical protein